MDVIVDGVPYVRADSVSHNKIGIAIFPVPKTKSA